MSLTGLFTLFIGLPAVLYLGIKIEMSRRQRKYRKDETYIRGKYQDNLFILKSKHEEEGDDEIKKAS